ncbi:sugar kinase [Streptobacillus felis]|uniref:Sugar kinase n=1 Tax=Streptobacillus felis TaxID=1384509 RepID=A0A7Z0PGG6_9FUSO|nr:sugar kinase [Streptobacillus felis]NYV27610.1 sugar kinase [Streptobacillus felis]
MKKVLLVGEAMMLLMAEDKGKLSEIEKYLTGISGAELNVCVGLTRLGFYCEYITRLGHDPFGEKIQNFLEKEKIGSKYVEVDETNRTGLQLKSKVNNGDPLIHYFRKDSAASKITKEIIDRINLEEFDLIHITGIPLGISESFREAIIYLIKKAKEKNIYITFDPNLRPQMWDDIEKMKKIVNDICTKVDLILPGIGECEILLGLKDINDIKNKYFEMGVKRIIIKDGERGSYCFDKEKEVFVPSFKVEKVVDTVGAGDGFAVGIISSILDNLSCEEMLKRANAIGAIQVGHRSDNEGLPTREKLEEFIKTSEQRDVNE